MAAGFQSTIQPIPSTQNNQNTRQIQIASHLITASSTAMKTVASVRIAMRYGKQARNTCETADGPTHGTLWELADGFPLK